MNGFLMAGVVVVILLAVLSVTLTILLVLLKHASNFAKDRIIIKENLEKAQKAQTEAQEANVNDHKFFRKCFKLLDKKLRYLKEDTDQSQTRLEDIKQKINKNVNAELTKITSMAAKKKVASYSELDEL